VVNAGTFVRLQRVILNLRHLCLIVIPFATERITEESYGSVALGWTWRAT